MLDENTTEPTLTPGEHLRNEMKRLGYDQKTLADEIDVSRQIINYIVNDKQKISVHVARELATLMELPPGYWLRDAYFDRPSYEQADWPRAVKYGPGVLVDSEIQQAVENGDITVSNFNPDHIRQASLDLTVGNTVVYSDGTSETLNNDIPITIEPWETCVFLSAESLSLNNAFVGRVGGTTDYARRGIALLHGFQIDPGFEGPLQFGITNLGANGFEVTPGQRLLSVEFSALSNVPQGEFNQPNVTLNDTKSKLFESDKVGRFCSALEPHLADAIEFDAEHDLIRANVPGLYNSKSLYPTKEKAKQALLVEIKRRIRHLLGNEDVGGTTEFGDALRAFAGQTLVTRAEALEICKKIVGEDLREDHTAEVEDFGRVNLSIPEDGGHVSLWSLIDDLNATQI